MAESATGPDRRRVTALFVAIFAAAAGTQALTPTFPEWKQVLAADDAAVRALTTIFTVGSSLAGFALGALCDRLGRRRVLLPALATFAASNLALYFARSYDALFALRGISGLAQGGIAAAVVSAAADAAKYEQRGRVMAIVLSGSYAAAILGIPLAGWLATIDLSATFLFLAALAMLALAMLWRALPADVGGAQGGELARLRAAVARPGAKAALFTTFANTVAAFTVITSLADHAVDRFGVALEWRSGLFLMLGLASLPGAMLAARICDRAGKRRTVIAALVASLALTPLLLPPEHLAAFVVAALAVAVVQAFRQGPFFAILTELAPAELRGSLVGWNSLASGFGLGLGAWLGGVLYQRFQLQGPVLAAEAALACSLAAFALAVPEPVQSEAETGRKMEVMHPLPEVSEGEAPR